MWGVQGRVGEEDAGCVVGDVAAVEQGPGLAVGEQQPGRDHPGVGVVEALVGGPRNLAVLVGDQRPRGLVCRLAAGRHVGDEVAVMVPLAGGDLHETHAGLDELARQQTLPAEAVRRLMRNILFFAEDPELVDKLLATACDFVQTVPVRRLTFYPDSRVWDEIRNFEAMPTNA